MTNSRLVTYIPTDYLVVSHGKELPILYQIGIRQICSSMALFCFMLLFFWEGTKNRERVVVHIRRLTTMFRDISQKRHFLQETIRGTKILMTGIFFPHKY